MRIVFVTPYFYPALQYGGTPRAAYELARALAKRGNQMTVLTTDSAGDSRIKDEGRGRHVTHKFDGLEVHYYPNLSNRLAFGQRIFLPIGMRPDIRNHLDRADVVHIHEFRSLLTVIASKAAKRGHLPYVVSPHGGLRYLGKEIPKRMFDFVWGKQVLANAAAVAVVSEYERKEAASFNVSPKQIRLLPNPIVIEEFDKLPAAGSFKSRRRLAGRIILFLGRLHWVKGGDLLVKAFAQLKHPDLQLVIAGPDDGQKTELMQIVESHRLSECVVFTGFLDSTEKLEALIDADVVVVPSRSEVFSITATESLLCGTPVIVSSCCGLQATLNEQAGVRRFLNEDIQDLVRVLADTLSHDTPRAECAKAREIITRELSAETVAAGAESLYRGL